MGNSICWYFLVKCTQLFPVFTAKNLAPIFQAASRSRLHCPLQISHVASLPFFVSQYLVLSSPFGCRSTLPHPRQHLLVRNSDTATTSTLLDNRCWISFTGPLQPFPPRTHPELCGRNPGFPNKTTVCRSLMLVVIPGDFGLFEVPQAGDDEDDEDEDSSVNGVEFMHMFIHIYPGPPLRAR